MVDSGDSTATPASHAANRLIIVLVALLFVGNALNYVDRQVLALLKPTLEAEFHWRDADYAHLGASFQIAAAAALLFVGWFVDRLGVRIAYGIAVATWSMAGMAHALAATMQQFVAARIVLAVGESVSTPAGLKAAAIYLPACQRNLAIGLINTAPNIGAILTPILIPPFALAFGWKAAFVVTGSLGFIWLTGWMVATRKLKPVGNVPERAPVHWSVLLRDRRTWAVIGAKALTDCVWWFVLFWMPDFFNRQFGMSQGALGWPIAVIFTLAALGAMTSGARPAGANFSMNAHMVPGRIGSLPQMSARTLDRSRSALRQVSWSSGSKSCCSTARTRSSSSGGQVAVVPKVGARTPDLRWSLSGKLM